MIEIVPLERKHVSDAASLFTDGYRDLRQTIPALPGRMAEPESCSARLEGLAASNSGVVALEGGRLVGYLGWFVIDSFRTAGYCPEWAHAVEKSSPGVYWVLYRAAASCWVAAGCNTHAINLLAHDTRAVYTWFWNGFGLTVVDAIRSLEPWGAPPRPAYYSCAGLRPADADALAVLEAEHCRHYREAPVLMEPHAPDPAEVFSQFLSDPCNSAWLVEHESQPAGYIRFESRSFGAASIVQDPGTVAITGAYVRPAFRGQGAAPSLLDAFLRSFKEQGFERCSVDFESFNPEAAAFWLKYFDPVCLSVIRVPELLP